MAKNTLKSYLKRINRVLRFIETHLDDELPLEELAKIAYFSNYHFHRIFTGMVGESVKNYIRRLRLERAAHQLLSSKLSVTEIAFTAGYQTLESFSKAFLQAFKITPKEFRSGKSQISLKKQILIQKIGETTMQVAIKNVPKLRVAYVRHVGHYNECAPAWHKLFQAKNLKIGPNTQKIGVGYDDPEVTPPEKIRFDACITVDEDFEAEGDISTQDIAGGKYAVYTHIGPYEKLAEIYATLCGQWLPQNGYEIRSEPTFQIYKNDPKTTQPEKLETEIYIPVR